MSTMRVGIYDNSIANLIFFFFFFQNNFSSLCIKVLKVKQKNKTLSRQWTVFHRKYKREKNQIISIRVSIFWWYKLKYFWWKLKEGWILLSGIFYILFAYLSLSFSLVFEREKFEWRRSHMFLKVKNKKSSILTDERWGGFFEKSMWESQSGDERAGRMNERGVPVTAAEHPMNKVGVVCKQLETDIRDRYTVGTHRETQKNYEQAKRTEYVSMKIWIFAVRTAGWRHTMQKEKQKNQVSWSVIMEDRRRGAARRLVTAEPAMSLCASSLR